jgi:copper chaperone
MHNTSESTMISFEIQDMICGHCREAITRATLDVDSAADVEVDLARHLVRIRSAEVDAARFSEAIEAAGYTPRLVGLAGGDPDQPGASGCSCASNGTSCGMRPGAFMGAHDQLKSPKAQMEGLKSPRQSSCCSTSGSSCGN